MLLYAKKLNNSAASYIELGQYDQAISRLKKALHLIKQSSSSSTSSSDTTHFLRVTSKTTTKQVCCCRCCCCNYCILGECMAYSEEKALYAGDLDHTEEVLYDNNMDTESMTLPTTHFQCDRQENDNSRRCEGYIYRRPIRFAPRFLLDEDHDMGQFLSLPLLFNLALVHHLKFVAMFTVFTTNSGTATTIIDNNNTAAMRKVALQKVLRLYELTYAFQTELIANKQQQQLATATTSSTCILCTSTVITKGKGMLDPDFRFNIIICNNLSQVHKILQNHEKQKRCLQQLLSMLMYLVDLEQRSYSSSRSHENTIINEQEYDRATSSPSSSPTLTMIVASLPSPRHQRRRKWLFMDLDGFLQNTSPTILQDNCAMAA